MASTPAPVLALDIGTSSVRAALFDHRGKRLPKTLTRQVYVLRTDHDGRAELDPAEVLRQTVRCVRSAIADWKKISAVGVSCFWHSVLGTDEHGEALTPIYTWADSRCGRRRGAIAGGIFRTQGARRDRLHAARLVLAGKDAVARPYTTFAISKGLPLDVAGRVDSVEAHGHRPLRDRDGDGNGTVRSPEAGMERADARRLGIGRDQAAAGFRRAGRLEWDAVVPGDRRWRGAQSRLRRRGVRNGGDQFRHKRGDPRDAQPRAGARAVRAVLLPGRLEALPGRRRGEQCRKPARLVPARTQAARESGRPGARARGPAAAGARTDGAPILGRRARADLG